MSTPQTPGRPVPATYPSGNPDADTVLVHGSSLAGLALAARLAKAGHHVVLDADGLPDGGHWARYRHLGVDVDELPQTFLLPAAWRDLFKKSGRSLEAELERHGLQLVPAPDQVHRFADGKELLLPTERGEQFHAVAHAFGEAAARRWCELLDRLDEVWQQVRLVGLERPVTTSSFSRDTRRALLADTTLDQLAEQAGDPHLARIVRSQAWLAGAAPGPAPALLAVRLAVQRRFGCWQLLDADGVPVRASRLVELLSERLDLRGVERVGEPAALLGSGVPDLSQVLSRDRVDARASVDALPVVPTGFAGRHLCAPAMAPTVQQHLLDTGDQRPRGVVEEFDHSGAAVRVTWRRALPDGRVLQTCHDHGQPRPDVAWGLAPTSWKAWRRRPLLGGGGTWHVSAASHGGNEPWQELLSAALGAYEVHEFLTGQDIRPTNRNAPRPPRQARPARERVPGTPV